MDQCQTCPVGKYQDTSGQNTCKDCAEIGWNTGDMFLDIVETGSYMSYLQTLSPGAVIFQLTPIDAGSVVLNVGTEQMSATSDAIQLRYTPDAVTPIRIDVSSGRYEYRELVVVGQQQGSVVVFDGQTYVTNTIITDVYAPFAYGKYYQSPPDIQCSTQ